MQCSELNSKGTAIHRSVQIGSAMAKQRVVWRRSDQQRQSVDLSKIAKQRKATAMIGCALTGYGGG